MVKAESLMLGDWVKVVKPEESVIAQVEGLSNHILCGGKINDPEGIEPLGLTEEILNQIADYNKEYGFWQLDFYYIKLWDTEGGKLLHIYSDDDAMEYGLQFAYCFYVHELQHLLRVIGKGGLADKIKL